MSMICNQKPISLAQILASRLQNCLKVKDLESTYVLMIKHQANQDCFLINQFISFCVKFHQIDLASFAFNQMEVPNVFVYNAMMRGFVQSCLPIRAINSYLLMLKDGVSPSSFTFSSLIKACTTSVFGLEFGRSVHGQIWRNGFGSHVFVQTGLIDFYSNLDKIGECWKVFEDMPDRDVFAWTTMVSSYVRRGDMGSAQKMFDKMPDKKVATWNTMIAGYARVGDVEMAVDLFRLMPVKDLITWTTMINCYSQNNLFKESLQVFAEMQDLEFVPDEVTISTVISACAHLGALELGREIHEYVLCNRFHADVFIGSALIDMYAKCGSLERSLVVFFKLPEKNLFCWNSVIEGLASHGYGAEALAMFKRMERNKVKPNGVTFISVLSACTHAGLVEEGRKRFSSMIHDYSIIPGIEHYGCMVDLLSKAGFLEDALQLTKTMIVEPNSIVWGAILGGCKLHKNLEVAKVAVEKLMLLEPDNSGYYLLLIKMYAEANMWNEVAEVRMTMKERGVQKTCPGSSWIELDGSVEEFIASDVSHPMCGEICKLLHEMDWTLKLLDYVPEFGITS